ncbi:TetR/AcrR family transcriptional regulator [Devosia beringensis]|uniref:TetR/AcrR family transcriptional regulator n=1 Tax=Devosia beringensis TaxID=2657486 RepID=UPI00186B6C8A|nr:TetR/AcrR family transcriptional regulator [Devosia beringensis]
MQGESNTRRKAPIPARGRGGRPSAAQAGDVDRRLLDAAQRLFLAQGFDLTNCEQVAAAAGAGKASLYARYANKQELFAAVVRRNVDTLVSHDADPAPADIGVRERLRLAGNLILEHALREQVVALMRLVVSTATRFPDLAGLTNSIGRERGVQIAAAALAGREAGRPEAMARAMPAAAKFIDMAFVPLQMQALLGADLATLLVEAPQAIDEAVALLSAGGWLADWH